VKLTAAEFEERWTAGVLKIALIGMSNIGKSWMSAKLAKALGIKTIEVDHYIRRELGQDSMDDFAQWLGHPNTSGYKEREAKSLALEDTATLAALNDLAAPCILDTTGSVIYCPKSCARLTAETYVVYLRASDTTRQTLEQLYFSHPKPLNWNGHFEQAEGELFGEAVARSYPKLLDARDVQYAALSDHTLSAERIYEISDPDALFTLLKPTSQ